MISSVIDEGAAAANMCVQWWSSSVIASYTTPHVPPLLPCFGVAGNAFALISEQQNYFPRTEKQVRNVVFAPLAILTIDKLCNSFYIACVFWA